MPDFINICILQIIGIKYRTNSKLTIFSYSRLLSCKMEKLSNNALIKACAESIEDQKAWIEFIRRFDRNIKLSVVRAYKYVSIKALGREIILKEDIRDLVQDVYIKLVRNDCNVLKNFKPKYDAAVYTYLSMVCASVVVDYFKKFGRLKRKVYTECIDEKSDVINEKNFVNKRLSSFLQLGPEEEVIAKDFFEKVKSYYCSVNCRKEDKRRELMFQLYFVHGLSIKDISLIKGLNISLSNANKIVWKMKREIRSFVFNNLISPET